MKFFLLAIAATIICGCSASKKADKYNESVKRGISDYIQDHPCINDTITTTKTDTVTETQFKTDSAITVLNDTVTLTITKTKQITKFLHDTTTKYITDSRLINFWHDSASAANRTAQILQAKLSEQTIKTNDAEHASSKKTYWLIGLIAAFGIWIFRKPLLALV